MSSSVANDQGSSDQSALLSLLASATKKPITIPVLSQDTWRGWFDLIEIAADEGGFWNTLDPNLGIEPVATANIQKAKALILPSLCREDSTLTKTCADPRAALVTLRSKYEQLESEEAFYALAQLKNPTLLPGAAINTFRHLDVLRSRVVAAMPEQGLYWDDRALLTVLLDLLPGDYGHLRSLVDGAEKPNRAAVLRGVAICETRLQAATATAAVAVRPNGRPSRQSASGSRDSAEPKTGRAFCTYCRRTNHTVDRCFAKRRDDKKRAGSAAVHLPSQTFGNIRVASTGTPSPRFWLLDSGASRHMTDDPKTLSKIRKIKPQAVEAAGKLLWASQVGEARVRNRDGNVAYIEDVLLVKGLRMKLLSASQLVTGGRSIVIKGTTLTLYGDTQPILRGSLQDGVYILDKLFLTSTAGAAKSSTYELPCTFSEVADPDLSADVPTCTVSGLPAIKPPPPAAVLAHRRFAHLSEDSVAKIANCTDNAIPRHPSRSCDCCAYTKLTVTTKKFEERAPVPLGRIALDICGPFKPAFGGYTYFLTIVDSFSRRTWVEGLIQKSDAPAVLERWRQQAQRECGHELATDRLDGGGELLKQSKAWANKLGVQSEPSVPYTGHPHLSERGHRIIQDGLRVLLKDAKLPNLFWFYAAQAVCYITNLMWSGIGNMSKFEAFDGRRRTSDHIRVWGCRAIIHMPKESLPQGTRHKAMDRGKDAIFVGYVPGSTSQYLFWVPDMRKVVKNNNVVFREGEPGGDVYDAPSPTALTRPPLDALLAAHDPLRSPKWRSRPRLFPSLPLFLFLPLFPLPLPRKSWGSRW